MSSLLLSSIPPSGAYIPCTSRRPFCGVAVTFVPRSAVLLTSADVAEEHSAWLMYSKLNFLWVCYYSDGCLRRVIRVGVHIVRLEIVGILKHDNRKLN